mmetsp:Transcript_91599/g.236444  ORF Transcript_91599/g.236444 Transcript_91599/m.236444 type:complete len:212 (-) Transcript_91599:207-842(-)
MDPLVHGVQEIDGDCGPIDQEDDQHDHPPAHGLRRREEAPDHLVQLGERLYQPGCPRKANEAQPEQELEVVGLVLGQGQIHCHGDPSTGNDDHVEPIETALEEVEPEDVELGQALQAEDCQQDPQDARQEPLPSARVRPRRHLVVDVALRQACVNIDSDGKDVDENEETDQPFEARMRDDARKLEATGAPTTPTLIPLMHQPSDLFRLASP